MKKLISVFAALALVGSLAAQKGKKPAKAPAAPVVAAPKAPAMPAAVTAAPAAAGAAKGMGLFIDLRGSYTFSNGTTDAKADGTTTTLTNADVVTYKTSASQGFGGGVSIGYDIASNLGLVASYDIRSIATREYKSAANGVSTINADAVTQQKWTNQVIGLGFRPHVNALGGEFYGGAGFAIVLPFETTQTSTFTNPTANWTALNNANTKKETVNGYNLAMGAYGEVGYKFMFTDNIGLNLGLRALVATANNIDKTEKVTDTGTVTKTTTTTYKESVSATDATAVTVGNDTTQKASFKTLGITDFSANVGISLKF